MNEKNIKVFIDFGSSKIRLGVFNREISKSIFILEKDCVSNFSLNKFDINNSKEVIKDLIKSAEKKIDMHIKNINLMIDTPGIFSIDFSIKKNSDKKKYSENDIHSLLNEAKNIVQKNYIDQKIIHIILKKFVFDDQEFFEIPNKEINYNSLEIELKFICFPNKIWKNLQESFNSNYLKIDSLYCSSYVKSANYNSIFDNYKRKVFLDIGYGKSAITIFEDKRILYINILPVGGRHITNDIASLLKINPDEAENFKKSLNQSETTFVNEFDKDQEKKPKDFINQIIHARVDEIIKLNLTEEYFNTFLSNNNDNCILIFIGNGSKILNKNSIYLEEKFDFFKEINFFEENSKSICQSGFNFIQMKKSQEVNFVPKKPRNKGFFEKFFHLFN
jgi:cell division protein FtsA